MHERHPKTTNAPHAFVLSQSERHDPQTATNRQEGLPNRDRHPYPCAKSMKRSATRDPLSQVSHDCIGNGRVAAAKWTTSSFQTDLAKNHRNTEAWPVACRTRLVHTTAEGVGTKGVRRKCVHDRDRWADNSIGSVHRHRTRKETARLSEGILGSLGFRLGAYSRSERFSSRKPSQAVGSGRRGKRHSLHHGLSWFF